MTDLTRDLAGTVLARLSQQRSGSLRPAALDAAKLRLLDGVGAAFAGLSSPLQSKVARLCAAESGPYATWGSGPRSSAAMAAFYNGVALRYLDLNDTFMGLTGGHPSDMLPALLQLAQLSDSTGPELLAAIVAAYDLYCGLCQAVDLPAAGLDQSVAAALGVAGAGAGLLGLGLDQITHAISIALSANLGLFSTRMGELSDWKACAGPDAAARGLHAVRLAAVRIGGPDGAVQGRGGLEGITGPIDWPDLPPSGAWILQTHLKRHPICYHGQTAVDCAVALHGELGAIGADDLHTLRIEVNRMAHRVMGLEPSRWQPATRETADHSLPYCVAVALRHGAIGIADFAPERLAAPEILALIAKITVTEDPVFTAGDPADSPARLVIDHPRLGEVRRECRHAAGHFRNPLSHEHALEKFWSLWPAACPADQAEALIDEILTLDAAADLTGLQRKLIGAV